MAVGGGGIRTMQRYWDQTANRADQRAPQLRQQVQQPAIPGGGHDAAGTTTGYADADRAATYDDRDTVGRDVSGPTTDDAMTRSEEELRVGATTVEEVVSILRTAPRAPTSA